MTTGLRFLAPALILLLCAAAADNSGKWVYSVHGRKGPSAGTSGEVTLKLKQDGDKLTGSVVPPGSNDGLEIQIHHGKVEGNKLTFDVERGDTIQKYEGKVSGDQMKLTIIRTTKDGKASEPVEVTAHRRCPPDCG